MGVGCYYCERMQDWKWEIRYENDRTVLNISFGDRSHIFHDIRCVEDAEV